MFAPAFQFSRIPGSKEYVFTATDCNEKEHSFIADSPTAVRAMIAYAQSEVKNVDEAMKIAVNAADYLVSITFGDESPLAGLPPTFSFLNLDREIVRRAAPVAEKRENTVMMIYPAEVGSMYLQLEEQTRYYCQVISLSACSHKEKAVFRKSDGSWGFYYQKTKSEDRCHPDPLDE